MLKVTQANFLATIQDDGRQARKMGFTSGGAMDKSSLHIANQLVNNPDTAAAIEITYGAFALEVIEPCWVGLAGADLHATINDQPILPWQNYHLQVGDLLKFTHPEQGLRAYLAIQGGIATPDFMGSQSAVIREGLPGLCGRALSRGDQVIAAATSASAQCLRPRYYARWHLPDWVESSEVAPEGSDAPAQSVVLDFYPTYQWRDFPEAEQQRFMETTYKILPSSNRMGYRLSGAAIQYPGKGLVSEGIAEGSLQVPPDGQPIVLMRDHPSVGGYPKLGVVTERSINHLAQLSPGSSLRFNPLDYSSLSS